MRFLEQSNLFMGRNSNEELLFSGFGVLISDLDKFSRWVVAMAMQ